MCRCRWAKWGYSIRVCYFCMTKCMSFDNSNSDSMGDPHWVVNLRMKKQKIFFIISHPMNSRYFVCQARLWIQSSRYVLNSRSYADYLVHLFSIQRWLAVCDVRCILNLYNALVFITLYHILLLHSSFNYSFAKRWKVCCLWQKALYTTKPQSNNTGCCCCCHGMNKNAIHDSNHH